MENAEAQAALPREPHSVWRPDVAAKLALAPRFRD